MNRFRCLSALAPTIMLVSILGCSSTATRNSAGEYLSDGWITTKVKAALVRDVQVKATEVNVETFKGVVQLSGFVSSDGSIDEAVRIANSIDGVTSVKNDMRIR